MEEQIVNRVSGSSLISIDLADFISPGERAVFDLKGYLFQGLILREKEFRAALKETKWSAYQDKHIAVHCSSDAIVPTWAYMLVLTQLQSVAKTAVKGSNEDLEKKLFIDELDKRDWSEFENAKVVMKGCSDLTDPDFSFFEATKRLIPWVSSLMYGEPCSTVPVFKRNIRNNI